MAKETPQPQKIQINTITDRLNYVGCLAAGAGLTAVALSTTANPIDIAEQVAVVAIPLFSFVKWRKPREMTADKRSIPMAEDHKEELEEVISTFSRRLTPSAAHPPQLIPSFTEQAAYNAYAGHKTIKMTGGLAVLATKETRDCVLAHEVAHIHAQHLKKATYIDIVSFALPLCAYATNALNSLLKNGAGGWPGMAVFAAQVTATVAASIVINRYYSRANEYQADRVAAQLTSPQQRINAFLEGEEQNRKILTDIGVAPSRPSGIRKAIGGLLSIHPSTENRIQRLSLD